MAYGLILMYKILPETESRTLEDIEIHFADKSKNLTHHKIPKKSKQTQGKKSESNGVTNNQISIIEDKNKRQAENSFTNSAFVEDHQHTKFWFFFFVKQTLEWIQLFKECGYIIREIGFKIRNN